jgi:hypothetical protein
MMQPVESQCWYLTFFCYIPCVFSALCTLQVDYLRAWMALVRPVPTAGAAAAAEGPQQQQQQQQVQAALAVAKAVVQRYADVGVQVRLQNNSNWRKPLCNTSLNLD